jgi:hypothetical protein
LFPLRRKDKQNNLNNQEKREKNQAALFIDGSGHFGQGQNGQNRFRKGGDLAVLTRPLSTTNWGT